jgi:hypothetical protein
VPDEGPDLAEVAAPRPGRRFLNDGVVAVAEIDPGQRAVRFGQAHELGRFPRIEGQGLLRQKLLAGPDSLGVDVEMDVVRRAVVDDVHVRLGDEGVGLIEDPPDPELGRRRARQAAVRVRHGRDLDAAETPQHLQVDQPDIACSDEPDLDRFHMAPPLGGQDKPRPGRR